MAKNKIKIDVIIDGKMQKVSVDAEKLGNKLDKVSKASVEADRNIKGVAGASSNASKNFSKMSQGMGGLVGAYAALAAQIFAISAAFNFLKSAGDLKVLEAGQKAYAANTGIAMRVLANDIIAATEAQITFQDASQAAAIGTAAGLSPQQLNKFGKAAKDLSLTLGRDVTDSFNRLIRGVTKAEPELLDELGIILRLKDAQEEYGEIIGKSADQLTQFEKTQAVANKVLRETEKVAGNAPEGIVNQYNQLGKAFDDVLITVKRLTDYIAGPLATVLSASPELAIVSFGLLLKGPLAAMGFSLKDIAKEAQVSANKQALSAQKVQAEYMQSKLTIESATKAIREQAAAAVAAGSQSKILQQFASGGVMTPQALATLKRSLQAAEGHVNKHGIVVKGIFEGMSINIARSFTLAMEQMELAEQAKVSGTQKNVTRIAAAWAGFRSFVSTGVSFLVSGFSKLLGALGWISILATGFILLQEKFGWFKKALTETEIALNKTRDRTRELNKEFEDFVSTQEKLQKLGEGTTITRNLGSALSMFDTDELKQNVIDMQNYASTSRKLTEEQRKQASIAATSGGPFNLYVQTTQLFNRLLSRNKDSVNMLEKAVEDTKAANEIFDKLLQGAEAQLGSGEGQGSRAVKQFKDYIEGIRDGSKELDEKLLEKYRNAVVNVGDVIKELPRLLEEASSSTNAWVQSIAPVSQGQTAISNLRKELVALVSVGADKETGIIVGSDEEIRLKEISALMSTIQKSEDRAFEAKVQSLKTATSQELALRNQNSEMQAIVSAHYSMIQSTDTIAAKQADITALREIENSLSEDQRAEHNRRIRILENEIYLEQTKRDTQKEQRDYLISIYSIQSNLRDLRVDEQVLNQAKEFLNITQQQITAQKEAINVQQTLSKLRMERVERDIQRSNPFAFLREEQRVAEATYRLEYDMIGTKIEQVNKEFEIKKATLTLEYALLDKRLEISEQEQRIKAEEARRTDREQADRLTSLADSIAAQRTLSGSLFNQQIQLLDPQQQAAIESVINELDKLDFARENLSDMAIITNNIVRDLHSGLSNVFSDLITNKVSSFKTAMLKAVQGVAESFAKVISDMFARNLIEGFMSFYSTKQNNPILGAAQQGSLKVASTLKNGAAAVANAIRAAFAEGAAAISAATAAAISAAGAGAVAGILGGTEKKESKGDFFENLFGAQGQRQPVIDGDYHELRSTPTPSQTRLPITDARKLGSMFMPKNLAGVVDTQTRLPITDARKLGSMFMPKNLAGVVDTQARFGPASDAQKLGSMFGKDSATFVNAQPTQGMFSGLMKFMGNIFSMDNPLIKGFQAIFSKSNPLLQGFGGLFGKLFSGLGSILGGGAGGLSSLIGGFFGFANGGMVKGGFRAYANGGVVTSPTLGLVGEGKYNEAIVPMPNGKAIPVDMKGFQGQNNNITINIDSAGGATTSGMSDQDNKQLGKAIAQAVQRELQNQKRSGGILSPYGVS
jgi:hypothetical protein